MSRVKIKSRGPIDRDRKLKLIEILSINEIHVTRIFTANDGFAVLPLSEKYGDKIFTKDIKSLLEQEGFNPLMPPELRVKKSVILTRIDDIIYEKGTEEIKEELVRKNSWIGMKLTLSINFQSPQQSK